MKTFLLACVATAVWATAAVAEDAAKSTTPAAAPMNSTSTPGAHKTPKGDLKANVKPTTGGKTADVKAPDLKPRATKPDTVKADTAKPVAAPKAASDAKAAPTDSTAAGHKSAPPAEAAKKQLPEASGKTAAAAVPKRGKKHHTRWRSRYGSAWKTGRNEYGFEGTFGGCHYHGVAGPHGYHIAKHC